MSIRWVTRAAWNAARSSGPENPVPVKPSGIAVHWSGGDVGVQPHATCAAQVRSIQRYHQQTKHWADIAYSFLICRHGYVFVGRGTVAGSAAQGTTEGNVHYWAVCFLHGPHDTLTAQAQDQFGYLYEYLRQRGMGSNVRPHSFFLSTQCPGPVLSSWLKMTHPDRLGYAKA